MEPKTFEEILREKMQQPVTVKGKDVSIMPTEAMVMSVMNNAMKGEIGAILFIRALTETGGGTNLENQQEQECILKHTIEELRTELKECSVTIGTNAELELLARQLIVLRRVASLTVDPNHKDVQVTPQRDGTDKCELSTTNKIFNDLYKQWRRDWREFKEGLVNFEIQRKLLNQ